MFKESFKGVSRKFPGCYKEVSRAFQERFKEVLRKFQEYFTEVEGFKIVSRVIQGNLKVVWNFKMCFTGV